MRKDIMELREVIVKLVPMLTNKGLVVTQRGSRAYVSYNPRTLVPETINIPNVSDSAGNDFVRAIQGFIDHEVAHVLITDWKAYNVKEMDRRSRSLQNLINIVEDTMIEREIVKIFPGSRRNISELRDYFIKKITTPALQAAKTDDQRFRILLVPLMRALAGHVEFKAWFDEQKLWQDDRVKAFIVALKPATLKILPTISKTAQSRLIAEEMLEILHPKKPPAPPTPAPAPAPCEDEDEKDSKSGSSGSGESKDRPEKEADEGDGDGERDHTESGEEGDEKDAGDAEGKSKGKAKGEPEEEEGEGDTDETDQEERDQDGSGGGSDGDEADADEDEDEGAGGEEPGDDEDGAGGEESEDEAAEDGDGDREEEGDEGTDDENDAGEPGDAEGDDDAEDDEKDVSAGSSSEDGSDDEGESDAEEDGSADEPGGSADDAVSTDDHEAGDSLGSDAEDNAGDPGYGDGDDAPGKSIFDFEDDAFEDADLSSSISIEISKDAVTTLSRSQYTVFTRELDRIEPLKVPAKINEKWVPELEEEVRAMTARMQKDIERMMAAQSRVMTYPGQRRGRLHAPNLYRLTTGDDRVFFRKDESQSKDTAVMLLIDNSGSMHGSKIKTAMTAGYALSSTLERVNIPNEVIGFTTGSDYRLPASIKSAMEEEMARSGIRWSRTIPLMMPIFKEFDERINAEVKKRIAYVQRAQEGLWGNVDGECLEYAAARLLKRREKRKVMIVLSDGQPVEAHNAGPHLKMVVQDLIKIGIEPIGIGIESNAVERFYPKHVVLRNAAELPGQIMKQLRELLTA